jgi:hypothetical protein
VSYRYMLPTFNFVEYNEEPLLLLFLNEREKLHY